MAAKLPTHVRHHAAPVPPSTRPTSPHHFRSSRPPLEVPPPERRVASCSAPWAAASASATPASQRPGFAPLPQPPRPASQRRGDHRPILTPARPSEGVAIDDAHADDAPLLTPLAPNDAEFLALTQTLPHQAPPGTPPPPPPPLAVSVDVTQRNATSRSRSSLGGPLHVETPVWEDEPPADGVWAAPLGSAPPVLASFAIVVEETIASWPAKARLVRTPVLPADAWSPAAASKPPPATASY